MRDVEPGTVVSVRDGRVETERFASPPPGEKRDTAHCFFEWIYFANVASDMDDRDVYSVRKHLGEALADQEELIPDDDTIVVPVPDTAKAAADAMAYRLAVPCLEGLLRNRYVGRTFIEGGNRADKARLKYTPLPEILAGRKVLLVEDTIVRSTTMRALIDQLRDRGRAAEVHVRVACPPIVAPCFYGIDMSTSRELFAPRFLEKPGEPPRDLSPEVERAMAEDLGADSLRVPAGRQHRGGAAAGSVAALPSLHRPRLPDAAGPQAVPPLDLPRRRRRPHLRPGDAGFLKSP